MPYTYYNESSPFFTQFTLTNPQFCVVNNITGFKKAKHHWTESIRYSNANSNGKKILIHDSLLFVQVTTHLDAKFKLSRSWKIELELWFVGQSVI